MKPAPHYQQQHDSYRQYRHPDSEISELPGECGYNGLTDDEVSWFRSSKDAILELLSVQSVRLASKALHLSIDYSELYVSAAVLTDIRPVFDTDRENIIGAIVAQQIKVNFLGSRLRYPGERELRLALDLDDIDKLIKELEVAKQKAEVAKKRISRISPDNAFIVGEETYGFG